MCFREIDRHVRQEQVDDLPHFFHRGSQEPESFDGILCWDVMDYLDRMPRRPATQFDAHSEARRRAVRVVRHRATNRLALHPVHHRRRRDDEDGPYPAARPRQSALNNRQILNLFEPLRVSDSFLLQSHLREILFPQNRRRPALIVARPVVALLTDFGLSDHYVAAMKGCHPRYLSGCDPARHHARHSSAGHPERRLELESVAPYLPPNTIVVGVVDPGVGSRRRAVAFDTRDGLRCVGPDNGLFSLLAEVSGSGRPSKSQTLPTCAPLSKTFEGRDRFAPASAWLARGVELPALGPMAGRIAGLRGSCTHARTSSVIEGLVPERPLRQSVDEYSRRVADAWATQALVVVNDVEIGRVIATYADAAPEALCALVGSSGRLEIAVHGGHAGGRLGIGRMARASRHATRRGCVIRSAIHQ